MGDIKYMWCLRCEKANELTRWHEGLFKYGVCPSCGASAYKNSVDWEIIHPINGYGAVPLYGTIYPINPTLDL